MKVTHPIVSKTIVEQTREKMEERLGRTINPYVLRVLVLLTKKHRYGKTIYVKKIRDVLEDHENILIL